MGVPGLWQTISRTAERKTLLSLALEHKAQADAQYHGHGDHRLRLGVDMSPCISDCIGATRAPGVYNQLPGGGLYIFFNKLAHFLRAPVFLVFVFDGPKRPAFKRGHEVRADQEPWWLEDAKDLIRYFGFQVHQAPGEGEAELARLNQEGHIDGVITSDVDAIVFGANLVLRTLRAKDKCFDDEYEVYTSAALADAGFLHGGFKLFALLSGGDYSPGIMDCGAAIAQAMVQCGFGDQLADTASSMQGDAFDEFLVEWRAAIQDELRTNSLGQMNSRQPHIADNISNNFPDREVLNLYLHPATSWTEPPHHRAPDTTSWMTRDPSIFDLARFYQDNFRCRKEEKLRDKFMNVVWEGIILQMICSPLSVYDADRRLIWTPTAHVEVLNASMEVRQGRFASAVDGGRQPRLTISTSNLVSLMSSKFVGKETDTIKMWVPAPLLPPNLLILGPARAAAALSMPHRSRKACHKNPLRQTKNATKKVTLPRKRPKNNPKGEGPSTQTLDVIEIEFSDSDDHTSSSFHGDLNVEMLVDDKELHSWLDPGASRMRDDGVIDLTLDEEEEEGADEEAIIDLTEED